MSFLKTVRFLLVSLPGRHALEVGLYITLFRLDCLPGSFAVNISSSTLSWSSTRSKSWTLSGFNGESTILLLQDIVDTILCLLSLPLRIVATGL